MKTHRFGTYGATLIDLDGTLMLTYDGNTLPLGQQADIPAMVAQLQSLDNSGAEPDLHTAEGINRFYTADHAFTPDVEAWKQDSEHNWKNVPNEELFDRYQVHAESYITGCRQFKEEPSYDGFRTWMCSIRDMGADHE